MLTPMINSSNYLLFGKVNIRVTPFLAGPMKLAFLQTHETPTPCSRYHHLLLPVQNIADMITLASMGTHEQVRF